MLDDKDLKQQILASTNDDDIPNLSTSIKQKYQNRQDKKQPWYKKGLFWGLATPILACGIILAIVIPNFATNDDTGKTPIINIGPHIVGKRNEIAFGVLSANNILADLDDSVSIKPLLKKEITQNDFETQMSYLNPYMKTAESMLGANLDLSPTVVDSGDATYPYLMQITSQEGTLSFYYNEIDENVKSLKSKEDDEDEEDENELDEEDDNEDIAGEGEDDEEQEYTINGKFVKDELTYYVHGEKEVEQGEYELKLNVFEDIEKTKKVLLIQQEIESEGNEKEQSYTYTTFLDNAIDFQAEVSFENEEDELEMEVSISKDNKTSTYLINKINDTSFDLDYTYDGMVGLIKVDVTSEIVNELTITYYNYKEIDTEYTVKLKRS